MIPYGRGPGSIARQVKGETGTDQPLSELEAEIAQMMDTWKHHTFPQAWQYMEECAGAVTEAGMLRNPWGRTRHFTPSKHRGNMGGLEREAQNFNIQSSIADTCLIAAWVIKRYRKEHNLHFRFVNQIHDAIMIEAPEDEVDATKKMFQETMGNIDIPIPNRKPLRLGIDIDVMTRWGEKVKEK